MIGLMAPNVFGEGERLEMKDYDTEFIINSLEMLEISDDNSILVLKYNLIKYDDTLNHYRIELLKDGICPVNLCTPFTDTTIENTIMDNNPSSISSKFSDICTKISRGHTMNSDTFGSGGKGCWMFSDGGKVYDLNDEYTISVQRILNCGDVCGKRALNGDFTEIGRMKISLPEIKPLDQYQVFGSSQPKPEPEPEPEPEPTASVYEPEPEAENICGEGTVYQNGKCVLDERGGGCLIATAAFGSEMAPQVQFLRELRDNTILQTQSGTTFMTGFNQFYYSFSPQIADLERENPVFKEVVKLTLTPLLTSLTLLNYVDIDTEQEMLGYGIGVILLNIGMYFIAPAVLIKRIFLQSK